MKKAITILLTLVMVLSLVACGTQAKTEPTTAQPITTTQEKEQEELTKEELLSEATKITISEIAKEYSNNKVRAQNTYKDGIYSMWGMVVDISEDHVVIKLSNASSSFGVNAYLPMDELVSLDKGIAIQVVGRITNIDGLIELKNAHFISDEYELKNATIREISYNNSTYGYTLEIVDETFGTIYMKCTDKQVSDYQWTHANEYTISAKGKITFAKVYGMGQSLLMDNKDVLLSKK